MQPWLGEEEVAAVAEVIASGWVAQGPRVARVRGRLRRPPCRPRTPWRRLSCTTALHLALDRRRRRPGRRGRRPVALVHRHRQRGPLRRRHAGLRRRRPGHRQPHRRATSPRCSPRRTRAVIAVDQGGVPVDLRRDPRAVRPAAASPWSRTPPAPPGSTVPAAGPVGAGAEIAAWSFHPRKILTTGEGGMLTTRAPTGPPAPAGCASTR